MGSYGAGYGMSGMLPSGPELTGRQALVIGSLLFAAVYVGLRVLVKDEPNPLEPSQPQRAPAQRPPARGSAERGVYR